MADDVMIRAEGLGKKYVIGHQSAERYTALRDVMARAAKNFARTARDMLRGRALVAGDEMEEFWALKDVSFEIKRGDVVGIIGRNGAGKSTLLKVLSRITEPSEGLVTIGGRIASLLEVGTGFHPELSGRENIYLNGAILGMTRAEIKRKFDEIVDFAGVERFLDTPVKRYSSGMYVRLAFAVAAHLEPEILIVDEVLAVGDAEFQKKCLGKMKDVAGHGRTVLFVSHNMVAIESLCERCILLASGSLKAIGDAETVVAEYGRVSDFKNQALSELPADGRNSLRLSRLRFIDDRGNIIPSPVTGQPVNIELKMTGQDEIQRASRIGIGFSTASDLPLFLCANETSHQQPIYTCNNSTIICRIAKFPLSGGVYALNLFLERDGVIDFWLRAPYFIDVTDASFFGTSRNSPNGHEGRAVLVPHTWSVVE